MTAHSSWPRIRLRHLSSKPIRNGIGESAQDGPPDWPRYVRITDIAGPRTLRDDTFASLPPDLALQAKLNGGDLLISAVGATFGKSYLHSGNANKEHCFAGYLVKVSPNSAVLPEFVAYWTESSHYWDQVNSRVIQATIQNFSAAKVKDLALAVPPLGTQRAIVSFLDRETAEADALVAKYERLIELLEEKRVALITQAVTKGLDQTAPMKDSGVEWIGLIPEHWEIGPVRRYYSVVDCKHVTVDFDDEGIPVASVREVKSLNVSLDAANRTSERWFSIMIGGGRLPRLGDVIFCRNVSPGTCSYVNTDERFAMGQDVCLIRSHKANGRYFNYVMRSDLMKAQIGLVLIGSTFNRINVSTIESLLVPQPDCAEQIAIASWLDERVTFLDNQSEKVKDAIRLVHEHRSALVTAAVTGLIDVTNYRPTKQPLEVPA